MKNILIVIPSLKKGGGAEKVAFDIASELLNNKDYNIVINTFYSCDNSYELPAKKIDFQEKYPRNLLSKIVRLFYRARKIKIYSELNKIDLIISFVEDANFPCLLSKIFFKNKSKIIISTHSSPLTRPIIYKFLMKIMYKKADEIVTVSSGIREILVKKFKIKSEQIKTIYNPLNISRIIMDSRENFSDLSVFENKSKNFIFISLGRLFRIKNHAGIIDAFSIVVKKYPYAQLVFIGEGPERFSLENKIRKNKLNKNIILLGLKTNPFPYLSRADCFVFNSFSEGFGVSVAEALACNLPVISSDCKFGPREILCNRTEGAGLNVKKCSHGILVPVDDPQSLAEAMEIILENDKIREEFRKKSQNRALDFDIKKIIKGWENLIDNA